MVIAMHRVGLSLAILALAAAPARADWPQFRGPTGQGIAEAAPLTWSEDSGVTWKTPLPGRGWSSPVVADGQIWLTTAVETPPNAQQQEETKAKFADHPVGGEMGSAGAIDLSAIQIDFETGEIVRTVPLFHVESPQAIHGLNSYASPTPVLADGKCYCHFGAFGTARVDCASGEVDWRQTLSLDHIVGPGSSPAVFEDLLIIPCDGADEQYVAALETSNGKIAWHTPRPPIRATDGDLRKAFCTPLVINVDGAAQAVIPGAQWFIAYDPRTGRELWRVDHGDGFSNVPRPLYDGRNVFLCTGFGRQAGLLAIDPRGSGDVTETHVTWREDGKRISTQPSPVLVGDRIYMINDTGVASCYDASTGAEKWRKRIAGNYSASLLAVDQRVYFFNREGVTTVIAAGDEFDEITKNTLDGSIMATPAAVGGDLVLRTDTHLYRIIGVPPAARLGMK